MTQNELLDHLEAEIRQTLETLRREIVPLPDEALHFRSTQNQWTIAECCAHLNVFFERYLPRIEAAVHKAKARKWQADHNAEVRYAAFAKGAIKKVHPGNQKKYRTGKKYDFYAQPLDRTALKIFIIHLERLARTVAQARETNINRASVQRGQSSFLRYTLGNVFEWLTLHSQRHLAQILSAIPK